MSDNEVKPLIRPGKLILLLLAGMLVYVVALVVMVPIGWIWEQASSRVPVPKMVNIEQLSGTLWQGNAAARVEGYPVTLGWDMGWPSLTGLSLPVDFSVSLAGSALSGDLNVGWPGKARVRASGELNVDDFKEVIEQSGGAMVKGVISIDRFLLAWDGEQISEADGLGRWPGGEVIWPMGRANFPPMQIDLDSTEGGVSLVIAEQGGDGPAARADVFFDGMLEAQVYKRLADLAGMDAGPGSPSDVVFRVRQPLMPGGGL